LKKIAIVLPDDLFLELVMEKIKDGIAGESGWLAIEHFRSYAQALDWLKNGRDTEGLFRFTSLQSEG
jgi:hypothetical protein